MKNKFYSVVTLSENAFDTLSEIVVYIRAYSIQKCIYDYPSHRKTEIFRNASITKASGGDWHLSRAIKLGIIMLGVAILHRDNY